MYPTNCKAPIITEWPQRATADTDIIKIWWSDRYKKAQVGIHCIGILVIDIDTESNFAACSIVRLAPLLSG